MDSCQLLAGMTGSAKARLFLPDFSLFGKSPRPYKGEGTGMTGPLGEGGAGDGVGVGAEPDGLRGLVVDHMTDGSPSTFDVGDTDDLFGFGVESHQTIRVHPGFYQPHSVLIVDRHAVGPCVFSAG